MTPFERASLEAARRLEVMPQELAGWLAAATGNIDGQGIHRSQLTALNDMMTSLTDRQRELLKNRPKPAASREYAEAELAFTDEVVGAYELWSAFRSVFEQRREERICRTLDAADLVAASAYRTAMDQAVKWKVVKATEYREPPLVCADAVGSPATAARGSQVSGLTSTIQRYRSKLMPIPLVLFPADRLDDIWTYSTLAHEVGHDLEADLVFSSEAIEAAGAAIKAAGAGDASLDAWRAWGNEVVADAVGVTLAGAGFAGGLADWLSTVALAQLFAQPTGDPHPPPHLRIRVLAGLLRGSGVGAWQPLADALRADMDAVAATTPKWQEPFADHAEAFATAVISTKLSALRNHAIVEFAPDIAGDAALAETLSSFIKTGVDRTPAPAGPPEFPARLVPSAAALAIRSASAQANLVGIATRALDYIHDIPRPKFLAVPPDRKKFLQGLAERLDVRPVTAG